MNVDNAENAAYLVLVVRKLLILDRLTSSELCCAVPDGSTKARSRRAHKTFKRRVERDSVER
jgi:hypothetical protein